MSFDPADEMVGGFTPNDGTVDFYLRVNSLIDNQSIVLDLGAGRAAWFEEDTCITRKTIRLLVGKAKEVIAADLDPAVMTNRASDRQLVIKGGTLNLKPNSIDIIIADYVLEHVHDTDAFFSQINSCLKKGGWFCARTPHKFSYVAIGASILKNSLHTKLLKYVQPSRKEVDVFPTHYKMNTKKTIREIFRNWRCRTFLYRNEPAYYFGKKFIYLALSIVHRVSPAWFSGNLFIFIKKP